MNTTYILTSIHPNKNRENRDLTSVSSCHLIQPFIFLIMSSTGVGETLLAALQASVSVLLVISYGGLAAKLGILSPDSTKAVSKVCVRMFLPALLITKLGAELDAGSAGKYGIIVVWGLLAHFISFLIGILGHFVFKMPDWVTVAVYVFYLPRCSFQMLSIMLRDSAKTRGCAQVGVGWIDGGDQEHITACVLF